MSDAPPGWRLTTVGEFCTYYKGGTPFEKLEYSPTGIPVLAKGDIKKFGGLEHSKKRYVAPSEVVANRFYLTNPGDFLMTTRDLTQAGDVLGLIARVPEDQRYLVNQGVNVVRFSNGIDWRYLVYWTNGPMYRAHMKAHAVGSTQIHIRKEAFVDAPLVVPPREEQEAISELLGALDDKIDANRRMNRTLDAMAGGLFQSWFVDFEPVRARAAGCQPMGMDAKTAALFPDNFEESVIGEVPREWRVTPLSTVVEVNPPRPLRKGEVAPYLDMKNMPTEGHRAFGWEPRPCGSGARFSNGDTLVARITPCLENGKTAFVDFLGQGQVGWGSTEYIVLRPKKPLPDYYAYLLARSDGLRAHAIQSMTGTTGRQRVPASAFDHFLVAEPPSGVAEAFGHVIENWVALIRANDEESRTLAALRDLLLPKLLSGELRVKDAEAVVSATV